MKPEPRYFRPGQFIFKEGEHPSSMFLVQKGTVAIRKMKGSMYVDLAKIYSNEVLGELSFFDRQPRSAAAIALTEVEALEISFESMEQMWQGIPNYFKTILSCVAERLRKSNEHIQRIQKRVVDAKDGVVGEGGSAVNDNLNTAAILAAVDEKNVQPSEEDSQSSESETKAQTDADSGTNESDDPEDS